MMTDQVATQEEQKEDDMATDLVIKRNPTLPDWMLDVPETADSDDEGVASLIMTRVGHVPKSEHPQEDLGCILAITRLDYVTPHLNTLKKP